MRSIFRLSDNLVPLFIGVLALILSIISSVPGRLEEHSQGLSFFIGIFFFLPITMIFDILNIPRIDLSILGEIFLILPFVLFAGYNICQIVFRDRHNPTRLQLSGIFSFLIVATTILSIHFSIPAKLCFFTHQDRFQQVLAESEYKSIKKIGLVEIQDIIVTNHDRENQGDKDIYFVTGNVSPWSDRFRYGFVYSASNLENIDEDLRDSFTRIYGKWYIFSNIKV
jgi:hypothetical protein